LGWGTSGGWNDGTPSAWPDWLQVDFGGTKTISRIDVFTVQDHYASPIEPTPETTFTQHGIRDFDVEYWNGSAWATVPGGSVTENDKVWRSFVFHPVQTSKIRVTVNNSLNNYSRLTEVGAWGE